MTRSDNDESAARNSTNDPQTFQFGAIEGVSRESSTCFSPRYPVASGNASPICIPDTYDVVRIAQYMGDALKIPHGYLQVIINNLYAICTFLLAVNF